MKAKEQNKKKEINIHAMTPRTKYEFLIGMIEGNMKDDNAVVWTEKLLDALLDDLGVKL